jgi:AraC-like DNA-binding protein
VDYRNTWNAGQHTLFPNGYSGIFFNFGNRGKIIINEELKTPFVSVFGQIDRHFSIIHYPGFYSFGILFKPTILSWLLKIEMSSLTNKAFDAQLLSHHFKLLHKQMEEVSSIGEKIKLFEDYLIRELTNRDYTATLADHTLSLIHQNESIQGIAKQLQVSQRYLEIQFKNAVGLSPKTYSLIVRFKRIEEQLKQTAAVSWRELPFAGEYHDQNHFIKEFKRFTGLTPSSYLLTNLDMGRSYLR